MILLLLSTNQDKIHENTTFKRVTSVSGRLVKGGRGGEREREIDF